MPWRLEPLDAGLPNGALGRFTTRYGGVSAAPYDELNLAAHVGDDPAAIAANRARLSDYLGNVPLVVAEQVHGSAVAVVDQPAGPVPPRADALVTSRPGVALVVLVADCLPVLLADPDHGVVAVAHAGRAGLAAGVLEKAVGAMQDAGAVRAATVAVIGPAVCGSCYEVPAAMRDEVATAVPGSAAVTRTGTPSLDLARGAEQLLAELGVGSVRRVSACTVEDERFFSYRRDGTTGRFAGVAMLSR